LKEEEEIDVRERSVEKEKRTHISDIIHHQEIKELKQQVTYLKGELD
jgi:hypothetical protein